MSGTVAIVALVAALVGALGMIAWLAKTALDDRTAASDARFDVATMRGEMERVRFELEVTTKTLAVANARADVLEEELSHAIENAPALGDGLAADDVGGRVLRLAQRWREATGAGGEVPAGPEGPVPDTSAAGAPDARALPGTTGRVP